METEVKEILEEINELGAFLKESREKIDDLEKAGGSVSEELEKRDKIIQELVDTTLKKQDAEELLTRFDEMNNRLDRIADNTDPKKEDVPEKVLEHKKAFRGFLRNGIESQDYQEFWRSEHIKGLKDFKGRALSESTATEGGFLVDAVTEAEILKNVVEMSPIRTVARLTTITTNQLDLRRRTGQPTMTWEGESGSGTESSATYGKVAIPVHAGLVLSQASIDFLMDIPNIETEIGLDAAEEIARGEGAEFCTGTGVNKPMGISHGAGTDATKYPATVTGGDAVTFYVEGDDFYNLLTTLKTPYRRGSTFLFNSVVYGRALKLKDSQNNYLWQPGLSQGAPPTIAGRPYVLCEDIADDGTTAYMCVYFGDFYRGYRIADRSGIMLTRDPYSAKPDVQFQWRKRVGGGVAIPEAIKILVTA